MAKKTGGQNPVDEAYLRSLMAGGPSEPLSSPAPSITGESGSGKTTLLNVISEWNSKGYFRCG